MIHELLDLLGGGAPSVQQRLSCFLVGCAPVTQWRLFPDKVNALDLITALGAFGSFVAVGAAAVAILQSAKARNLSTVIELTRQLAAEREKAHSAKVYGMEDADFHAYQMVHLIEQASMIVNNGWISGQSKAFLLDWLSFEIPAMAAQPTYKKLFDNVTGQQLQEIFKLRDRFASDQLQRELERKTADHFERIYLRRRSGRSKPILPLQNNNPPVL